MAFKITNNSTVKGAFVPLQDGEYTATIKSLFVFNKTPDPDEIMAIDDVNKDHAGAIHLEKTDDKDPYMILMIDGRPRRYYLNNETALEIATTYINTQLDIKDPSEKFYEWFGSIVDSEITVWLLTVDGTDKQGNLKQYQNIYLKKPDMFDAVINGLIG